MATTVSLSAALGPSNKLMPPPPPPARQWTLIKSLANAACKIWREGQKTSCRRHDDNGASRVATQLLASEHCSVFDEGLMRFAELMRALAPAVGWRPRQQD
ncbi:hypothetical protein MY4824_009689 [Beauveria thailandica]